LRKQKKTSWGHFKLPSFLPSDFPPLRSYSADSFLSPAWEYKGVEITIGERTYQFDSVQDDSGMDCGVGMNEESIELGPLVRSASHSSTRLEGMKEVTDETTIAVCSVRIANPPMEIYTIVNGLKKKEPLLGRFMLHDVATRTYSGILSDEISDVPPPGSWTTLNKAPSWKEITERFQKSPMGKKVRSLVEERAKIGISRFKGNVFAEALAHFRWVSVFGFFTHSEKEQYSILKNLASGWERYLLQMGESLEIALLWAKEAQKYQDTDSVRQQIARIENLLREEKKGNV